MPEPKVTVCTPVYNLDQYVAETLSSLAAQTFEDFEVLIVDDGSTDNSAAVIKPYLSDPRFKYVHQENSGVGAARNRAIELARGEWFAPVDGDDLYFPDALQVFTDLAESDPRANVVYADMALFREDGYETRAFAEREMPEGDITRWLYARPRFGTLLMMIRTADLRAVGGYRTDLPGLEDYDMWLRFAQRGVWAKSSHKLVARYRIRANSKTSRFVSNTQLMVDIVEAAIERETRPELVRVLGECLRFHRSQLEMLRACVGLARGESDVEHHLWRSFSCDKRQKRVLAGALILAASRLTRIRFGHGAVERLLEGALDMPWNWSEMDMEQTGIP